MRANLYWYDTTEDHNWFTAVNWDPSGPPTLNDQAIINFLPGPTIASEGAVAYVVYVGYGGSTGALTVDGGTLMTSPWGIAVGEGAGTVGTFNMNSGTVTTTDFMLGYGGTGTLNMTGGTIIAEGTGDWDGLFVGGGGTGIGHLHLDGGTITTTYLQYARQGGSGTIDITAGTLIIDGDVTAAIEGYIDDGWITAYGGAGQLLLDFDTTNTGKTTLTATFGPAINPNPKDGATDVCPEVVLSWTPGPYADKHDVYFGTDETKVTDANSLDPMGPSEVYRARQDANSYTIPEALDLGKTYYWRIDEVNMAEEPNTWQGKVWSFTTIEYLVVDDMESYGGGFTPGEPGSKIEFTWKDGDGWKKHGAPVEGNGTGSVIGHADSPFVETVITHGGGQSMPYYYNNGGGGRIPTAYYSEARAETADLPIGGSNWASARVLSLWFYGDPSNDANEQMYVALVDAGDNIAVVEYDGDMNDIKIEDWQEWLIALQDFNDQGVNLADVNHIYIGFGNRDTPTIGGSGLVFFDDIRLYAAGCYLSLRSDDFARVDYVQDCVIDYKELEIMAEDWLAVAAAPPGDANLVGHWKLDGNADDSSGHNNHGTLYGGPQWVAGKVGSGALDVDGIDDYVDCGNDPSLQITGTEITVAAWVKARPEVWWSGIAGKTASNWADGYALFLHDDNTVNFYVADWRIASESFTADDQWHHVAGTYDGSNVRIWVDGVEGTPFSYTGSISDSASPFEIGRIATLDVYTVNGTLDDVRIYNVALSESEILGLVGLALQKTDLYEDLKIDFKDYAILADKWLDEQLQ